MSTQEITLQVVARTFYRNYVEIQAITITTIIFTHTHTHTHTRLVNARRTTKTNNVSTRQFPFLLLPTGELRQASFCHSPSLRNEFLGTTDRQQISSTHIALAGDNNVQKKNAEPQWAVDIQSTNSWAYYTRIRDTEHVSRTYCICPFVCRVFSYFTAPRHPCLPSASALKYLTIYPSTYLYVPLVLKTNGNCFFKRH